MKILYHGHACFELRSSEGSAVFDPYAPGKVPGLVLPALRSDRVFCSHGHADHAYAEGVALTGEEPSYRVETFPAFHDHEGGRKRGSNTVTAITAEGLRVVHCGDLGHPLSAELAGAIGPADVLMVPVGGYYTIGAEEAAGVCEALQAKLILPMHCRTSSAGYDVLSPVADFLRLFPAEEVLTLEEDALEVTLTERRQVVLFPSIR